MDDEMMSPGEMLRSLVASAAIQVPGAPTTLAGRLIEAMEFPALYVSGAAFSATSLALPDIGLFSLTELAQQVDRLASSVSIPIIVDADTGFGEAIHVERTVMQLERAGAAAIQLEDQQLPKRCGHLSGKLLVDSSTMCAKLRAAASARTDESTVIIARTDARDSEGMEGAIGRAQDYVAAGADWIFPEALADREEFSRFAEALDVPLVANMTEFGKSPLLRFDELEELGYKVVLYPVTLQRVAMRAIETALVILQTDGTQQELVDLMQTRQELYDLLEYDAYEERDRAYFGPS